MNVSEIVINENYSDISPMQFGYEDCKPSHFYGPAVREYWLLHYVVSGKGVFEREGILHEVRAGQIFVIPPYVETYYQADTKEPWSYVWVGFDSESLASGIFKDHVITVPGAGKIFSDMKRCSEMNNGRSAYLCAKICNIP